MKIDLCLFNYTKWTQIVTIGIKTRLTIRLPMILTVWPAKTTMKKKKKN